MKKTLRKRGKVGKATQFVSRNQALKRLQISLVAFRKVCILRNVYPRSNDAVPRFHVKDIASLMQDPIIDTIRQLRIYRGKYKRFLMSLTRRSGQEKLVAEFEQTNKPFIDMVSVVKERYPTFDHALEDLDEALNNIFLYARLPKVNVELVEKCRTLSVYFLLYVLHSKSLTKVFISIKGYYFQADIHNHKVTWLVPHTTSVAVNTKINFEVMDTFVELNTVLLELTLFKLFGSLSGAYPPSIQNDILKSKKKKLNEETVFNLLSTLNCPIELLPAQKEEDDKNEEFPDEEQEKLAKSMRSAQKNTQQFKNLFAGYKFFLSREVPQEIMTFVIASFGGQVSFNLTENLGALKKLVAPFNENDDTITHHIVDRSDVVGEKYPNRLYVQPQWVFDCVNHRQLIPTKNYLMGDTLPPHFSPFDREKATIEDGYKEYLFKTQNRLADDMLNDDELTEQPQAQTQTQTQKVVENKKLLVSSMPKKRRRLYEQIKKSRKGKSKVYKKKLIAN